MKRFFLIIIFTIIILAGLTAGFGLAMAEGTVFRPDNALYSMQRFAERQRENLAVDETDRAMYLLRLVERRLYDLESLTGTQGEAAALNAFDDALRQAVVAVGHAPLEDLPDLKLRMADLVGKADSVVGVLVVVPADEPELLSRVQKLLGTLKGMVGAVASTEQVSDQPAQPGEASSSESNTTPTPSAEETATIDPQVVQFPEGSAGAAHEFFQLTGKHSLLACEDCHIDGKYAGTPNECGICHAEVRPVEHFQGECSSCHTTEDWTEIIFDHDLAVATDCISCHENQKPINHFSGQCSACHQTAAWKPASFDHDVAGATNCQGCHANNRPNNHYSGQCSACHRTSAWRPASFNHTAAGATNCQSCHSKDRPGNHYSGQCSACHKTSAWRPASFNHNAAGATNCQNCHKPPANHWSGNCSKCHSTSGWGKISVSGHSFPMNHGKAGGNCSACHDGTSSKVNCYKCHNKSETEKKHKEEGIFDIAGRCLSCHPNGEKKD
jgi:hypothetical protein